MYTKMVTSLQRNGQLKIKIDMSEYIVKSIRDLENCFAMVIFKTSKPYTKHNTKLKNTLFYNKIIKLGFNAKYIQAFIIF